MKRLVAGTVRYAIAVALLLVAIDGGVLPRPLANERDGALSEQQNKDNKQPADFLLETYFGMENPQEAARQMREDARARGLDIRESLPYKDRYGEIYPTLRGMAIRLPYETITPDPKDVSFLNEVKELERAGRSEEEIVCILQLQMKVSIDEIASLLDRGMRIYKMPMLHGRGFIARAKVGVISSLSSLEFVRWVGRYEPRYKYNRDRMPDRKSHITVWALASDRPSFREDLEKLGATSIQYALPFFYTFYAEPSVVEELAGLWWVYRIDWSLGVEGYAPSRPGQTVPTTSMAVNRPPVNLKPQDSRRLISPPPPTMVRIWHEGWFV